MRLLGPEVEILHDPASIDSASTVPPRETDGICMLPANKAAELDPKIQVVYLYEENVRNLISYSGSVFWYTILRQCHLAT